MTSEYSIRQYKSDDEHAIVTLLELVFGGWPKFDLRCTNLEHWKWKYLDNPFHTHWSSVGVYNDKIIGCDHSYPVKIKIEDRSFFCSHAGDTAVHPDWRRKGIMSKMIELCIQMRSATGVEIGYYTSDNPIVTKSLSSHYPKFPFNIYIYVRINDINLHFRNVKSDNSWLKKLGYTLFKWFNKFRSLKVINDSDEHDFSIQVISEFDEKINVFWDKIKNYYSFISEKSEEFLNWRYCDPRGGDYILKIAQDETQVLGFSVSRINRFNEGYNLGYIVDLISIADRLDVFGSLLSDCIKYFEDNEVNVIYSLNGMNRDEIKILRNYGFVNSFHEVNVFFKRYVDDFTPEVTDKKIHFTYGNFDHI